MTLTRQYDPWGNLLQGQGTGGYAFTGREWDTETGLYYYRARYYDSKLGRFVSEDPAGLRSGLNRYAYVANRPINLTDPSGLDPCLDKLEACLARNQRRTGMAALACIALCGSFVTTNPSGSATCVWDCWGWVVEHWDDRNCNKVYSDCLKKRGSTQAIGSCR